MHGTCDAVVIGAGHNGLTCAAYLAKAGLSVLVLDAYDRVGGQCTSEELTLPGYQSDVHAIGYQFANLSPTPDELKLAEHGFELIRSNPNIVHVFPDGTSNGLFATIDETCESIGKFSNRDAQTWRTLFEGYLAQKEAITASVNYPPISFSDQTAGLSSPRGGFDLFRFQLQSVRAWADEVFEAPQTKLLVGTWAAHVGVAPDDGGGASLASLFNTVIQDGGNNLVKGGMHNLPRALVAVIQAHGGKVRTGTKVEKICVVNSKAVAVRLRDGEEIEVGTLVASSADPRHLALDLLGEDVIGGDVAANIRRYEYGLAAMSVFLALDRPCHYTAGEMPARSPAVHCTPANFEYLGQVFLEVRSGLLPSEPFCALWNEGSIDPSRIPPGKGLLKLFIAPVPYKIKGDAVGTISATTWDEAKEPFVNRLIARLERDFVPDLRQRIVAEAIQTPVDFERLLPSCYQGTVMHGSMVAYQMGAMRPIPELSGYRAPVSNVYLCGAGSHPGAGISMLPGRNAAQVIFRDLGIDFARTLAAY
ncbi:MAG: phytoene desaturase family protein [Methylocystis sp.]|uniref:phytoene desaturase family protein n=1 Tax=Methylocystis sp. TaxID=1911079 RepID=UPI003D12FDDF